MTEMGRTSNAQRSTLNVQRSDAEFAVVERWKLNVERWTFRFVRAFAERLFASLTFSSACKSHQLP